MTIHLTSRLRVLAAVLLFVLCTLPLTAQTSGLGGIAGVVRDSTGAIVPGTTVTLTNSGTGASRTLTTNSEGFYQAQFLQPGTYEVVLGGGSFGKVDRKNIPVTVGADVSVDVTLPLASVTSEVTVSSEAPVLDTEKVEQSQVVDQNIVSNVPVASRRFESFVLLTPNVVPDGNTGLIAYRGINGVYNQNIVDGVSNNDQFWGEARGRSVGAPYIFPIDAISQFESSVTGYSAEIGGGAGGIINAITKSGSNAIHGDAFEYYRTPGWNALDPISKYQGRLPGGNPYLFQQPTKIQNQFGLSIGGPIIKDKLFYHFTYDGFRKVNPILYISNYNSTTTSVAKLANLCNGGATPVVEQSTSGGVTTTTTFPTTIPGITVAQCNAAVSATQEQLGAFARNAKQNIFFPRLDYQLNPKTHLSAEYLWDDFQQPNGYTTSATATNSGIDTNGELNFHQRYLIANAETALTSHTANVVHFQWSRDLEAYTTNAPGPYFSLTGIAAFGETNALPRPALPDEHRIEIADVYSWTHGHHTVKAGFDLSLIHDYSANLYNGNGNFSFSQSSFSEYNFSNWIQDIYGVNNTLSCNNAPTACTTAASTSAGPVRHFDKFVQTIDPVTGNGSDDMWEQAIDGFVEDAWKITPKLLLDAGVRYDIQLVPQMPNPNTVNPLTTLYTSTINIDKHMFAPRIGFNWNPQTGTVVRGGYGIFYGENYATNYYVVRTENGRVQQQYTITPEYASTPYTSCATGTACTVAVNGAAPPPSANNPNAVYPYYAPTGATPYFQGPGGTLTNPVNGAPITASGFPTSVASALGASLTLHGVDPHFLNPFSHSWDLTVEQQLPLRTTLTVGYVGNRGMRLPVVVDTNVNPASATFTHTYQYTNPVTGQVSLQPEEVFTDALYASTSSIYTSFSAINSNYHSFVTTIKHPFSNNIELLVNYTWAKAMDGGEVAGGYGSYSGGDTPLVPIPGGHRQGIGAEYARSDLDVRNRGVVILTAQSNFGIANRLVKYAVDGWRLSGTYTAQTGEPVTATASISSLSSFAPAQFGIPLNDGGATNAVQSNYGPPARVPTFIAGRNTFKGPGIHNFDGRVSRDFPIFGHYHLELAAEAFNVANHRNIFAVNTTYVSYSAPGKSGCPSTTAQPGSVGCLGPLSSSTAAFMSPSSTSGTVYGPRQLQLLGKFTF